MIASLPMYDRPELAGAHDALWSSIRDALRSAGHAAPDGLNRDIGLWAGWRSPDLLLGQICGLPLRARLKDRVTPVATLDYGVPDSPPGFYRSAVVTRRGDSHCPTDYADARLAINEPLSQSGWAAAFGMARDHGFGFRRIVQTGAHRASALAVADGRADLAFIDAITLRGLARFDASIMASLQCIGHTAPAPGLVLVTAKGNDPVPLRQAVHAGVDALAPPDRDALGLRGVVDIPLSRYHAEMTPPPPPGPGIAIGREFRPSSTDATEGAAT